MGGTGAEGTPACLGRPAVLRRARTAGQAAPDRPRPAVVGRARTVYSPRRERDTDVIRRLLPGPRPAAGGVPALDAARRRVGPGWPLAGAQLRLGAVRAGGARARHAWPARHHLRPAARADPPRRTALAAGRRPARTRPGRRRALSHHAAGDPSPRGDARPAFAPRPARVARARRALLLLHPDRAPAGSRHLTPAAPTRAATARGTAPRSRVHRGPRVLPRPRGAALRGRGLHRAALHPRPPARAGRPGARPGAAPTAALRAPPGRDGNAAREHAVAGTGAGTRCGAARAARPPAARARAHAHRLRPSARAVVALQVAHVRLTGVGPHAVRGVGRRAGPHLVLALPPAGDTGAADGPRGRAAPRGQGRGEPPAAAARRLHRTAGPLAGRDRAVGPDRATLEQCRRTRAQGLRPPPGGLAEPLGSSPPTTTRSISARPRWRRSPCSPPSRWACSPQP